MMCELHACMMRSALMPYSPLNMDLFAGGGAAHALPAPVILLIA